MRAHIIENGIVTNTIEVESLDFLPNLVSAESGGTIGDRYENGEFLSPLPEPPSDDELFSRLRIERDTRINSVLWMRERHSDELELGKETTLTPEQHTVLLTYIQALRDITEQPGAPWDGGGELTPWPEKPNF